MSFTDTMTLGQARDELRRRVSDGEKCPCCTQLAKVYKRALLAVSARALIVMYRSYSQDFGHLQTAARVHMPKQSQQGGYLVLTQHWGMIEEELSARGDGGRSGYWRVTDAGVAFVNGESRVPKYAHTYDGRCLKLDGQLISIRDALGKKFDYDELMRTPGAAEGAL